MTIQIRDALNSIELTKALRASLFSPALILSMAACIFAFAVRQVHRAYDQSTLFAPFPPLTQLMLRVDNRIALIIACGVIVVLWITYFGIGYFGWFDSHAKRLSSAAKQIETSAIVATSILCGSMLYALYVPIIDALAAVH